MEIPKVTDAGGWVKFLAKYSAKVVNAQRKPTLRIESKIPFDLTSIARQKIAAMLVDNFGTIEIVNNEIRKYTEGTKES